MTVIVRVGRRVPRGLFRRGVNTFSGLVNFQTNIWIIIEQSFRLAKKKATEAGTLDFVMRKPPAEKEDLNYNIEWIEIIIRGTPEQEEEEYCEAMKMYDSLGNILKKAPKPSEDFSKRLKSMRISQADIDKAYAAGYGASAGTTIAQKLLEMGILTTVSKTDDCGVRDALNINE